MFDFKETSENLRQALEGGVRSIADEYRPQLKQDIDEAIEKAERSFGGMANANIEKLSAELDERIRCAKDGLDDSVRLAKVEMISVVDEAATGFRKAVVIPLLSFLFVAGMAVAGAVGFLVGRG